MEEQAKKDAISWLEDGLVETIGNPEDDTEEVHDIFLRARTQGLIMAAELLKKSETSFEYLRTMFPHDEKYLDISNKIVFAATILINHQIGHTAMLSLTNGLTADQLKGIKDDVANGLYLLNLLNEYYKEEETMEFILETRDKIFGIISRS